MKNLSLIIYHLVFTQLTILVVYTKGDHEGTLQIEYDDETMESKLLLTRFGSASGT